MNKELEKKEFRGKVRAVEFARKLLDTKSSFVIIEERMKKRRENEYLIYYVVEWIPENEGRILYSLMKKADEEARKEGEKDGSV